MLRRFCPVTIQLKKAAPIVSVSTQRFCASFENGSFVGAKGAGPIEMGVAGAPSSADTTAATTPAANVMGAQPFDDSSFFNEPRDVSASQSAKRANRLSGANTLRSFRSDDSSSGVIHVAPSATSSSIRSMSTSTPARQQRQKQAGSLNSAHNNNTNQTSQKADAAKKGRRTSKDKMLKDEEEALTSSASVPSADINKNVVAGSDAKKVSAKDAASSSPLFDPKRDQDVKGVNKAGLSYGDDARLGKISPGMDERPPSATATDNTTAASESSLSKKKSGSLGASKTNASKSANVGSNGNADEKGSKSAARTESQLRKKPAKGDKSEQQQLSSAAVHDQLGAHSKAKSAATKKDANEENPSAEQRTIGRDAAAKVFAEADAADPKWSMGYAPESPSRAEQRKATAAANVLNHYGDSATQTQQHYNDGNGNFKATIKAMDDADARRRVKADVKAEDSTQTSAGSDSAWFPVSNTGAASLGNKFQQMRDAVEDKLEDSALGKFFAGRSKADETKSSDDADAAATTGAVEGSEKPRHHHEHHKPVEGRAHFTSSARPSTAGTGSVTSAISSLFGSSNISSKRSSNNHGESIAHDFYNNPSLRASPANEERGSAAFATASQQSNSQGGGFASLFGMNNAAPHSHAASHQASNESSQSFGGGIAGAGGSSFTSTSSVAANGDYLANAKDANPFFGRDGEEKSLDDPFNLATAKKSPPTDYSSPDYLVRRS